MKVVMSRDVEQKLWAYVDAMPKLEIGGCGYGWLGEDGDVVVDEIFLMPQEVSGGKVDFKEGAFAYLIEKAVKDNVLGREDLIYFSWHSHNSMGVFFSGTDEEGVKDYGNTGINHLISFVGNLKHEYKMRYDAFNVMHHGVPIAQVSMEGLKLVSELPDASDEVIDEIEAMVEVKKYTPGPKNVGLLANTKSGPGFTPKFQQPHVIGDKVENALIQAEEDADRQVEEALAALEAGEALPEPWEIVPDGPLEGTEAAEFLSGMRGD